MKLYTLILGIILISTASFASNISKVNGQKTGKYLQEIKNDVVLPGGTAQNIIQLIQKENSIIAVSPKQIFTFQNNKWKVKSHSGKWQAATLDAKGQLWLGATNTIQNADNNERIDFPQTTQRDTVFCLLWEANETLHVGTNKGLWSWNGSWNLLKGTEELSVRQITRGKDKDIWLATSDGIFRRRDGEWLNLNDYVMAPGLKRNFLSISNGASNEDVIFGSPFAVAQISEQGDHWTYTKEDGLPYGPITCICYSEEGLWLGTPKGAIKKNEGWHYYNGKRWLPDNKINDIICIDPNTVWIATPQGISEIKNIEMTLDQKSKRFNTRLNERHLHHNFVADCSFDAPGDTSSFKFHSNDNDGLWTSIYLASESFRYAVTGDQSAYDNAVRTFEAMEKLETINPIPGFVARSYVTIDEDTGRGGEWHATKDGKWKWKADTSSDEIVGHMFAYPIFYELVAKGEIKERAKNLVHRLMSHIVDNNFYLIDLDGKPTRWGVWSPDSLNNSSDWWYEKGINSLQILSHLKGAYFVTGDEKFEKAYLTLINDHHYVENMAQQKMHFPYEINHSDDELAFLPYYCLLRYVRDPELKKTYQKSMLRSWLVEKPDRNPLWNIIASSALDTDCDLEVAIKELKDYPMDIVKWDMENRHRWDLRVNPIADRFMKEQATVPIPVDERGITKWNSNPYRYETGGNGTSEDDGAAWLLPYWMGRYHRFIIEE